MERPNYILENDKLLVGSDYMPGYYGIFLAKTFSDLIDNDMQLIT